MTTSLLFGFVPIEASADLTVELSALDVTCVPLLQLAVMAGTPDEHYGEVPNVSARIRQLHRHHRVLELAASRGPVLPCALDTAVADLTQVRPILLREESALVSALRSVSGYVQMSLSVLWDAPTTLRRLVGADLRDRLRGSSPTGIAELIAAALDEERGQLQQMFRDRLEKVSTELRELPSPDPSVVYEALVLITAEQSPVFDAALEALDEEQGGQLSIRCVGPVPPLDFTPVRIERVEPEAITDAKSMLHVVEWADRDELARAYRTRLRQCHPDTAGSATGNDARIDALQSAYRLLNRIAETAGGQSRQQTESGPAYCLHVPRPLRQVA